MPKSIPNPPTPLPIVDLGKRAHADVSRRKTVPIEVWQSTPTFVRRAEIADYPLIAYTYHVTFKRPVGFTPSEPMWVNYIDPFSGEIVISDYPDRPYFPDDPSAGVVLGRKFEGFASQGSVEQPLFRPIDEPVMRAGFDRFLRNPDFLDNPNFFKTVPNTPTSEELAFAFAYWRQTVTIDMAWALNRDMWNWVDKILYDHHPEYPHALSDPLTGKPLVRGVR